MKHVKIILPAVFGILVNCALSNCVLAQQPEKTVVKADPAEIAGLIAAVEKSPDSLSAHKVYIQAVGVNSPEVERQYALWMKKFPKSANVPFALARAYADEESPKAKPYLLKAVALDPKHTEAWGTLWIDAERWGDFAAGRDYLAKAVASDPSNPNYSFYYASSFKDVDQAKWIKMSLDVAKKFPAHERGAQALYWLGARASSTADKIRYFQLLKDSYPANKFNWSSGGMSSYYYLLLSEYPGKAAALAQEMVGLKLDDKSWPAMLSNAKKLAEAKTLLEQKKGPEARKLLEELKVPRYVSFSKELVALKAEADDLAGKTVAAYDSLLTAFAKSPSPLLAKAISKYGTKLGKSQQQLRSEIYGQLDKVSKAATPFTLKRYFTAGNTSLSDYKGKVVLLTYWFPGCGPCRGEFPHFENVVRKFKGKNLEYVGINIASEQNDYVIPFLKTSGYSFTPLEDVKGRQKGNLDNRNAAPMNFLIDQNGNLVFSNFRTDGDNEDELELMIGLLLEKNNA